MLFAVALIAIPWPLPGFGAHESVPAARYGILAVATLWMAATLGTGGPVLMILGMLGGMALGTTLACAVIAWGGARLVARLPVPVRGPIIGVVALLVLLPAAIGQPYRTGFGRSADGGLLDILELRAVPAPVFKDGAPNAPERRAIASHDTAAEDEPCRSRDPLRRAFFGDTHVHTTFSFDAWGQGTLGGPADAYRFARGEAIGIQPYSEAGEPLGRAQLRRPLDFAVVTDHSDLLGETRICRSPGDEGYDSSVCRVMRRFPALGYMLVNGHVYGAESPERPSFCGESGWLCRHAAKSPWLETRVAAAAFDGRGPECSFTTFVGYEWTGMPGGQNIHRNVIFESDVVQEQPTTYIETPTAEGLWRALADECLEGLPGCDAVVIPHNSNVSNGLMWSDRGPDGGPLDPEQAALRARLETLVEVTQHKGDSECRAGAEDELCGYEKLVFPRMQDMAMPGREFAIPPLVYAREALSVGLGLAESIGVNPFRFGLIGSTDTHFATPGMVDEDAFIGHAAGTVSARHGAPAYPDRSDFNPGGLAVLYAEENTRSALFAAMQRREAYGTSGPRIGVRFFGGFDLPGDLCDRSDAVASAYETGVPMGGVMLAPESTGPASGAPRFFVSALADPGGHGVPTTPLQRIQIVKGWRAQGRAHERVIEIAGDADNGAEVDLDSCQPRGAGAAALCGSWIDDDFDASEPAFYYARVVENPSCRWNQWICSRANVRCDEAGGVPEGLSPCCDEHVPKTIQERAWTSPIWWDGAREQATEERLTDRR